MKISFQTTILLLVIEIICLVTSADAQQQGITLSNNFIEQCGKGNILQIRQSLNAGANVNAKDQFGDSALTKAVLNGNIEIVKLLLNSGADIDIQNERGETALMLAAAEGKIDIVKLFIDRGVDISTKNRMGKTALMIASEKRNTQIIELLTEADYRFYPTLFLKAASTGDITTIKRQLATKNANIDVINENRATALMNAANSHHTNIVELLIEKKAHLNLQNKWGNTALLLATTNGYVEIVKLLLDAGADPSIKGQYGKTALMWATEKKYPDIARMLKEVDYHFDANRFLGAAAIGDIATVEKQLSINGSNINVSDRYGRTALFLAAAYGHTQVVRLLISLRANRNTRTIDGSTPMSVSANADIIKLLSTTSNIDTRHSVPSRYEKPSNNSKVIKKLLNTTKEDQDEIEQMERNHYKTKIKTPSYQDKIERSNQHFADPND